MAGATARLKVNQIGLTQKVLETHRVQSAVLGPALLRRLAVRRVGLNSAHAADGFTAPPGQVDAFRAPSGVYSEFLIGSHIDRLIGTIPDADTAGDTTIGYVARHWRSNSLLFYNVLFATGLGIHQTCSNVKPAALAIER